MHIAAVGFVLYFCILNSICHPTNAPAEVEEKNLISVESHSRSENVIKEDINRRGVSILLGMNGGSVGGRFMFGKNSLNVVNEGLQVSESLMPNIFSCTRRVSSTLGNILHGSVRQLPEAHQFIHNEPVKQLEKKSLSANILHELRKRFHVEDSVLNGKNTIASHPRTSINPYPKQEINTDSNVEDNEDFIMVINKKKQT